MMPPCEQSLSIAFQRRVPMLATDPDHVGAWRLFHGFTEGDESFAIDLFAATAVIHRYRADAPVEPVLNTLSHTFPWIRSIILKERQSSDTRAKNGLVIAGGVPDSRIMEHGILHAVNLTMNRDCSFYPDTRNLRKWILDHAAGKRVLNTFAYTGSLGVTAKAAGAASVLQMDRNRAFLELAKQSCILNSLPCETSDFLCRDFFPAVSSLKKQNRSFDLLILDPPFFSKTPKGTVDLAEDPLRLVNKVRPLVDDGGFLIVVNNSLFLNGKHYYSLLQDLCGDGSCLKLLELIPIPLDFAPVPNYPVDPAPFNHPTKIAVFSVHKKARRS